MRTFASHQCGPGRRHMRVELVVSSLLSSERFFSGYPSFLLSSKTFPNSNSIWNARTRFNEFFSTPKCFVGKQITLEMTNSSSYNHVCYRIGCGPVTLYSFKWLKFISEGNERGRQWTNRAWGGERFTSASVCKVRRKHSTSPHPHWEWQWTSCILCRWVLLVTCFSRSRFLTLSYDVNYSKTCIRPCLVPRPKYSARSMCFGSCGPSELAARSSQIPHRNALTEKALEKSWTGTRQY